MLLPISYEVDVSKQILQEITDCAKIVEARNKPLFLIYVNKVLMKKETLFLNLK